MADVVLKNSAGEDVTYPGVEEVVLSTDTGETASFSLGGGSSDWADIQNKPFGEILEEVTIQYSETGDYNSAMDMYKVADAPASIYDVAGAWVRYYENDVMHEGLLYHDVINPLDEPADIDNCCGGVLDVSEYLGPGIYIIMAGIDNANAAYYVAMQDTTVEGVSIPAGVWAVKNSTTNSDTNVTTYSWIDTLTYTICTKLSRKFLPDNLAVASAPGDDVTNISAGNLHVYNIGSGTFDATTFDMSGYAVNDVVIIVGDIAMGGTTE